VHHALAGGTVVMWFADDVLWDDDGDAPVARRPAPHAHDAGRHVRLAAFVRHEVELAPKPSPFDGTIGHEREVAFAGAPLRSLHDAARRLADATVNDAVLAAVAGGLRAWIQQHHGRLGGVRVKVPVSLHHPGDGEGNRDSFFTLELPLGDADAVGRLAAVRAATAERKACHDAETLDVLMRDLARVSPQLEHFCRRLEASPRTFALNVSNVPGPARPVTVLGAPVDAVYSLAEIGERHALRIAVVSLGGQLNFGFCSDPAIVGDLEQLARGVEAEASTLVAAAR
jgi:diacylglycerol O-acyltransferase / wax synthase